MRPNPLQPAPCSVALRPVRLTSFRSAHGLQLALYLPYNTHTPTHNYIRFHSSFREQKKRRPCYKSKLMLWSLLQNAAEEISINIYLA